MRQSFWLTQPGGAVADDQRRVAARAVGDAGLDVDGDAQVGTERQLLAVVGADDVVEAEGADPALQLPRRVAGHQHRRAAVDVVGKPGLVEVIGVQVGDVQVGRVLDPLHQLVGQLIVAREHEPRAEERRHEPRIAQDRPVDRLDQDAGVADRCGAHSNRG